MKIVAISDSHGQHRDIILPDADMIIHAGDITSVAHGYKKWSDNNLASLANQITKGNE